MPQMTEGQARAAEAMADMRLQLLTSSPEAFGLGPDKDFPNLYGVILEFRIDDITATVYGLKDGSASVYTTGGFGVIGGIGHDTVRQAAKRFVTIANRYLDRARATKQFPYPHAGKAQFYFLTYEGPTLCIVDEQAIMNSEDDIGELYGAGQDVLTELRLIQEDTDK